MCSRFFIDFPDVDVQRVKLEHYLADHFSDDLLRHEYLATLWRVSSLYNVVGNSHVVVVVQGRTRVTEERGEGLEMYKFCFVFRTFSRNIFTRPSVKESTELGCYLFCMLLFGFIEFH